MNNLKLLILELRKGLVFYDVDTQNDFMNSDGSLYVPGAESIKENLKRLTGYARQKGYYILGSVDRHFPEDPELIRNNGPFPDHCMDGSYGQLKIKETMPRNPLFVENKEYLFSELEKKVEELNTKEIFFEKQHYDVFTNVNARKILPWLKNVVVYGVATDYCVKAAALGMREYGVNVFLVTDAIKAVNEESGKKALEEMSNAGVIFVRTDDVLSGKLEKIVEDLEK